MHSSFTYGTRVHLFSTKRSNFSHLTVASSASLVLESCVSHPTGSEGELSSHSSISCPLGSGLFPHTAWHTAGFPTCAPHSPVPQWVCLCPAAPIGLSSDSLAPRCGRQAPPHPPPQKHLVSNSLAVIKREIKTPVRPQFLSIQMAQLSDSDVRVSACEGAAFGWRGTGDGTGRHLAV